MRLLIRVEFPSQSLDVLRDDIAGANARTDGLSEPRRSAVLIPCARLQPRRHHHDARQGCGDSGRDSCRRWSSSPARIRPIATPSSPAFRRFGQLAGALADAGFIVVRYDRRGSGQSGGRSESAALADYADDVRTVVKWLAVRKDVDPKRIAVIGHDTGAWIAHARRHARETDCRPRDARGRGLVRRPTSFSSSRQLQLDRHESQRCRARRQGMRFRSRLNAAVLTGKGWDRIAPEAAAPGRHALVSEPARLRSGESGRQRRRAHRCIVHGDLDTEVPFAHAAAARRLARNGDVRIGGSRSSPSGVNHLLQPAVTGDGERISRTGHEGRQSRRLVRRRRLAANEHFRRRGGH